MSEDWVDRALDAISGGKYTEGKARRKEQTEVAVNEAVRRIDFDVRKRGGRDILTARISEVSDEIKSTLAGIGLKADENGKFTEGSLTWGDYYNVARAASDLQGIPLPSYLKDKDGFAREASKGKATSASDAIKFGDGNTSYLVGRLRVGVYKEIPNGKSSRGFELTVAPFILESQVDAEVTEAVYSKIKKLGVPLADTRWLHEVYKKL